MKPTTKTGMRILCALPALLTMSACGNLSGLGGNSEYACKAPPGVRCTSLTGVYRNAIKNNLPSQRAERLGAVPSAARPATQRQAPPVGQMHIPASLRSDGKVLRLWIKPWEDSDHDLIDQSFVYLQVERGRWQVEHVQRRAREPFVALPAADSTALPPTAAAAPSAVAPAAVTAEPGALSEPAAPAPPHSTK